MGLLLAHDLRGSPLLCTTKVSRGPGPINNKIDLKTKKQTLDGWDTKIHIGRNISPVFCPMKCLANEAIWKPKCFRPLLHER